MDLEILSLLEACEYRPKNRTYALRIASPKHLYESPVFDLVNSPLYTIVTYAFEDENPPRLYHSLTESLAKQILTDFKDRGLDQDTLLVHCSRGQNRSPAVGMALNDIFGLGYDRKVLKQKFPEANWHVYRRLLEVSKAI
ncbi:hypothetical protein J4479_05665 [Candidatus Woesearchaeota archaeon]|nr:hypothetical protein [Candidatus Woesearchaeota archaeon]